MGLMLHFGEWEEIHPSKPASLGAHLPPTTEAVCLLGFYRSLCRCCASGMGMAAGLATGICFAKWAMQAMHRFGWRDLV